MDRHTKTVILHVLRSDEIAADIQETLENLDDSDRSATTSMIIEHHARKVPGLKRLFATLFAWLPEDAGRCHATMWRYKRTKELFAEANTLLFSSYKPSEDDFKRLSVIVGHIAEDVVMFNTFFSLRDSEMWADRVEDAVYRLARHVDGLYIVYKEEELTMYMSAHGLKGE